MTIIKAAFCVESMQAAFDVAPRGGQVPIGAGDCASRHHLPRQSTDLSHDATRTGIVSGV